MAMVSTDQLTETIQEFKRAAADAFKHPCVEEFESLEKFISEIDAYVRELQQAYWAGDAKLTIRKLERDEPLDESDKELIRTFLISDAERYLAIENNFQDWLSELKRLVDDLVRRVNTVDRDTIADLRGVLKDAVRLVPDIRNYLDEQERVTKCKGAIEHLDRSSRQMLAKLLKEQLQSAKR